MSRDRIVVVCPGRGTYNQPEWGYLARHHANKSALLQTFDDYRVAQRQPGLRELDAQTPYALKIHSRGDHASALIYACAYADFLDIDRERFEVVAVTGKSMGWYIALAAAGALAPLEALRLINSMGRLMQESLLGGQLLYSLVDADWRALPGERERVLELAHAIDATADAAVFLSIELGGMLVFGGNEHGLRQLSAALPPRDRFPMRLFNHAAFHTPLQEPVRAQARAVLADLVMARPDLPLIDGRGQLWSPYSTDPAELWDYTLGHQLVEPYDFSQALRVALHEFAPDRIVVLGPGTTLGGAVAQLLIEQTWFDLASKADFVARQAADPVLLAMGMEAQRGLLQS